MQVLVIVLALIGGVAVLSSIFNSGGSAARVLKAANDFQNNSVAFIVGVREHPEDHAGHAGRFAIWQASRRYWSTLSPREQEIVMDTLKARGFPVQESIDAILGHVELVRSEFAAADAELAELVQTSRAASQV